MSPFKIQTIVEHAQLKVEPAEVAGYLKSHPFHKDILILIAGLPLMNDQQGISTEVFLAFNRLRHLLERHDHFSGYLSVIEEVGVMSYAKSIGLYIRLGKLIETCEGLRNEINAAYGSNNKVSNKDLQKRSKALLDLWLGLGFDEATVSIIKLMLNQSGLIEFLTAEVAANEA